jgi:DNA-binding NtrC family response regulator
MAQDILLVEDSDDDAFLVGRIIEKQLDGQFRISRKATMREAEAFLQERAGNVSLILLDLGLPDTKDGRDSFERMKKYALQIPIVILTGMNDHELALSFVREGAEDFVNKSLLHDKPELLRDVLAFAACRHQLLGDLDRKHKEHIRDKEMVISWMSGDYSVKK